MKNLPSVLIKTENVPLKGLPKNLLDQTENYLCDYLILTLNLKSEDALLQLSINMSYIVDTCRSMSTNDVVLMFELYATGNLDLEPRPNYIDKILIGKIINSYRVHNRKKEQKKIDEDAYKKLEDVAACLSYFDAFKDTAKLPQEAVWVYDYLLDFKKLQIFSVYVQDQKAFCWSMVKGLPYDQKELILKCKIMIVEGFFKKMQGKGLELKPLL